MGEAPAAISDVWVVAAIEKPAQRPSDQPLNPPYSLVCAARHVLADEVSHEPALEANGTLRCSESGCLALVYSHCVECRRPIPGYIDGPRSEKHGTISLPRGKIGTARGMLSQHEWREDCPHCKSPFPWATRAVWANYHRHYLADLERHSPNPLPHLSEAEAAYNAANAAAADKARQRRREQGRGRRRRLAALLFDTWPKRITAVVAAIVAVLALLFGVTNLPDLFDDDAPGSTTTTTQVPTTQSSAPVLSTAPTRPTNP